MTDPQNLYNACNSHDSTLFIGGLTATEMSLMIRSKQSRVNRWKLEEKNDHSESVGT